MKRKASAEDLKQESKRPRSDAFEKSQIVLGKSQVQTGNHFYLHSFFTWSEVELIKSGQPVGLFLRNADHFLYGEILDAKQVLEASSITQVNHVCDMGAGRGVLGWQFFLLRPEISVTCYELDMSRFTVAQYASKRLVEWLNKDSAGWEFTTMASEFLVTSPWQKTYRFCHRNSLEHLTASQMSEFDLVISNINFADTTGAPEKFVALISHMRPGASFLSYNGGSCFFPKKEEENAKKNPDSIDAHFGPIFGNAKQVLINVSWSRQPVELLLATRPPLLATTTP